MIDHRILLLVGSLCWSLTAAEPEKAPPTAPATDRVGFPVGYAEKFQVLRTVPKDREAKVVTVYGNDRAASVTNASQLPYPNGSVLVMETALVRKDAKGQLERDDQGHPRKDKVVGLHVMRREKGFGEAYGPNRTAEWEYVEYQADGGFLTTPQKSFTCAQCHLKAGAERDFVYHGRFTDGQ